MRKETSHLNLIIISTLKTLSTNNNYYAQTRFHESAIISKNKYFNICLIHVLFWSMFVVIHANKLWNVRFFLVHK